MSATDANFPPDAPKLNLPSNVEEARVQLERLIAQLNDYEDHDITFTAKESLAVVHGLRRVPVSFEVLWIDVEVTVSALPSSGWGYNVVYFQSSAAAHVRIRLR